MKPFQTIHEHISAYRTPGVGLSLANKHISHSSCVWEALCLTWSCLVHCYGGLWWADGCADHKHLVYVVGQWATLCAATAGSGTSPNAPTHTVLSFHTHTAPCLWKHKNIFIWKFFKCYQETKWEWPLHCKHNKAGQQRRLFPKEKKKVTGLHFPRNEQCYDVHLLVCPKKKKKLYFKG